MYALAFDLKIEILKKIYLPNTIKNDFRQNTEH